MSLTSPFRMPGSARRASAERERAAQQVLGICHSVDALAEQADASLGVDDERLFSLLEQREQMLADLAEHVVTLRSERPTADSPMFAASERVVDDADALISDVCAALSHSNRQTMALAVRVADRVALLRAELAAVHRAGSASMGYAMLASSPQMDNFR